MLEFGMTIIHVVIPDGESNFAKRKFLHHINPKRAIFFEQYYKFNLITKFKFKYNKIDKFNKIIYIVLYYN